MLIACDAVTVKDGWDIHLEQTGASEFQVYVFPNYLKLNGTLRTFDNISDAEKHYQHELKRYRET